MIIHMVVVPAMPLRISAGLYTNTAPTIVNSTTENTSISLRARSPSTSPITSGRPTPPLRMEIIPLR